MTNYGECFKISEQLEGVSALLQHALGLDLPLLLLDSENPVSLLNKSILEISLRACREAGRGLKTDKEGENNDQKVQFY